MRSPPITPACRSSFRTLARDCSAKRLLVADLVPNVYLDTSSTNRWMAYHPGLTLPAVFGQALEVAGADRLLFGTDSSFFPRGWNRAVYDAQVSALDAAGVDEGVRHRIFTDNFDRLFPA